MRPSVKRKQTEQHASLKRERELEYVQQVQKLRGLSNSEHDSNPPPGLLNKPEPIMAHGRPTAQIRRRHRTTRACSTAEPVVTTAHNPNVNFIINQLPMKYFIIIVQ